MGDFGLAGRVAMAAAAAGGAGAGVAAGATAAAMPATGAAAEPAPRGNAAVRPLGAGLAFDATDAGIRGLATPVASASLCAGAAGKAAGP